MTTPSRRSAFPTIQSGVAAIALTVALTLAGPAFAAGKGGGTRTGGGGNRAAQEPKVDVPPAPDPKAVESAQSDLTAARTELQKAQTEFGSAIDRLRAAFESSPEMAQAKADLKAAQDAYDAAKKPIIEKVDASADYKAASESKKQKELELGKAKTNGATPDQISALSAAVMQAGAAASKIENDAVAASPDAAAARAKVAAAGAKITKLKADFDASLPQNAEWTAAKKAVDDAKQKVTTAEAAYRDASQKYAADKNAHDTAAAKKAKLDEEYAAKNKAANNKTGTGNNTNGT